MLLNNLFRYFVRGVALEFARSCLCERSQYVKYGVAESRVQIQNLCVIQGSKVGPLFFDTYSSDSGFLCDGDKHIPYADDTCSVCIGDSLDSLVGRTCRQATFPLFHLLRRNKKRNDVIYGVTCNENNLL